MTNLQQASSQDRHIQKLKHFIITGWPNSKDEVSDDLKPYWSYRDELAVIGSVVLKGRHIIMPNSLKQQVLDQLHINHMGIEKVKLLAHEYIYWHSINTNIEKYIKQCMTCLEFQQMQLKEKIIHHEVPLRPWEAIGADVFHFNNINYLCVVDYNSKFPIVWKLQGLSVEHLINTVSAIFTEYGIPHKLMSDQGTNFVSEKFRSFYRSIKVEQASPAYHHQSNRQVEACIKFIKWMFKKCAKSGRDKNIALLQVCTKPIGQGLPNPVKIMFNRQVWGIMPVVDWKPLGQDHDDDHHIKLVERQRKNDNDTSPVF